MSVLQALTHELGRSERQIERLLRDRTPGGFYRRGGRGRWRVRGALTETRVVAVAAHWGMALHLLARKLGLPERQIEALLRDRKRHKPPGFYARGGRWMVDGSLTERRIEKIAALWEIPYTRRPARRGLQSRTMNVHLTAPTALSDWGREFSNAAKKISTATDHFSIGMRRAEDVANVTARAIRPAVVALLYFRALQKYQPRIEKEPEVAADWRTLPVRDFIRKHLDARLVESSDDLRLLELLAATKELQSQGVEFPYRRQLAAHMGHSLRTHYRKYSAAEVKSARLRFRDEATELERLVNAVDELGGESATPGTLAEMLGVSADQFTRDFAPLLAAAYRMSDERFFGESTPSIYESPRPREI